MKYRHRIATLLAVAVLSIGATRAGAEREATGPTPPRVALVDGVVTFWRPGAEDWTPAKTNTALAEGDELYVSDRGNVELQIGSRAFVRAGADTQIGLEALDADTMQYKVTGGHAAFDFRRLPDRQVVEIDTPRAAFTVDRPGYYRVDVEEQRTTFGARRGGFARVVAENGEQLEVGADQQLVLADDNPTFGVTPVAALDDWDRWNEERTASFAETPQSAKYVSQQVAGIDDLDRYGDWHEEPRYGRVWRPRDVGADWSPYSTGRWQYDPYYDWTWVDDAPWGWAPYHYGRWVNVNSYWGWAPGPVVVQPAYAPALVAFFGWPGRVRLRQHRSAVRELVPTGWGEPCSVVGRCRVRRSSVLGRLGRAAHGQQRRHQQQPMGERRVRRPLSERDGAQRGRRPRPRSLPWRRASVPRPGGRQPAPAPREPRRASGRAQLRGERRSRPAPAGALPESIGRRDARRARSDPSPARAGRRRCLRRDASPKARIVHPRGGGADRMASGRGQERGSTFGEKRSRDISSIATRACGGPLRPCSVGGPAASDEFAQAAGRATRRRRGPIPCNAGRLSRARRAADAGARMGASRTTAQRTARGAARASHGARTPAGAPLRAARACASRPPRR
jgi:hypothetical protein